MNNWQNIRQIIFDADDTLWENNIYYVKASDDFFNLISAAGFDRKQVEQDFDDLEVQVVKELGYGSKNFVLILEKIFEKYSNLNGNKLDNEKFAAIVKRFTDHPVAVPSLFPGVIETLNELKTRYKLFVLTKGEHDEQSGKIKRAGIDKIVERYYVPAEKNDQTYLELLKENNWQPHETCMVGNSPKSDINPALRCDMYAIHIPYRDTWKLDNESIQAREGKFLELKNFMALRDVF